MLHWRLLVSASALLACTVFSFAQTPYPSRPIKMIVPLAAASAVDVAARIVTQKMADNMGQQIVILNQPGASGLIGAEQVARAEPDGYTILLATNAYSVNYGLYNQLPYDPYKDFVGVSELATSPNTFVVRSELPAKTMKDFIALARANPEKYNCATPPIGTTSQLQLELLKIREKLPKLADVVFKGGGDAIAALLAGTTQLSSGSLPPALPHIKEGTLRCLAVTGDARWPDLPDVPTMEEAGYKDFVFAVDCVLLAPAKTPPETVKWLEAETLKVLMSPDTSSKLVTAGFQVRAKGAAAAWTRVMKEVDMFKKIIDQAGVPKL
jgi:tripartite-type tricarboxylate transporter receptor subunit TctC